MRLLCIKSMIAHWGSILTEGKWYDVVREFDREIEIITNEKEYWKHTSMIASSIDWVRKGYEQADLHKVIPGYKTLSEVHTLYAKKIVVPHFEFKTDDNSIECMCILSDEELFALGADKREEGKKNEGRPAFGYTIHQIDDYFDYVATRRDRRLKELGI